MFADRRRRFMEQMGEGVALLFAAPERIRSHDTYYPYRQDSYFHYLTGFPEPGAAVVLIPGHPEHEFAMFVRPRDREMETWNGRRAGPEGARERYGADAAFTIDKLPEMLGAWLGHTDRFFYAVGRRPEDDRVVFPVLEGLRAKPRTGVRAPGMFLDPFPILNEMRLHKTPEEVDLMRRAAAITAEAHTAAMQQVRPGMHEYEVQAVIERIFRERGGDGPGYGTIAGSGVNATILHYEENESVCRDGDLLLVDAGAEYRGYCADITRTFPVNGRFSGPQKAVYEIVLEALLKSTEAAQPGRGFNEVHDTALRVLVEGLRSLGLLQGEVDGLIESEAYKPYYMHRTSHWLGRDVHDVGEYRRGDEWRRLEPGMILTVEPGLYFTEWIENLPAEFRGIGVRIEDDVLITATGHEVITSAAPKTIADIEAVMAAGRRPTVVRTP